MHIRLTPRDLNTASYVVLIFRCSAIVHVLLGLRLELTLPVVFVYHLREAASKNTETVALKRVRSRCSATRTIHSAYHSAMKTTRFALGSRKLRYRLSVATLLHPPSTAGSIVTGCAIQCIERPALTVWSRAMVPYSFCSKNSFETERSLDYA